MESLSLACYRLVCRVLQLIVLSALPFFLPVFRGEKNELRQRSGWIPGPRNNDHRVVWIHAASVGEVKAAAILIEQLNGKDRKLDFMVSTVTRQGRKIARRILPPEVETVFAPLDLPECVSLAVKRAGPSLYICLETELWPNLLTRLKKDKCPAILLNARMSERSCRRYRHFRWIVRPILADLAAIGAITDLDRRRYLDLGAKKKSTRTCGNLKYDQTLGRETHERSLKYRGQLHLEADDRVLVAGSTHTGEEAMILDQYRRMQDNIPGLILILAPRHIERIEAVEKELHCREIAFSLLSRGSRAGSRVILVDTMGDLAGLYGLADWVFCGGSLVDRGGHNIMEAAIHGVPVFYGPDMKDFADAVAIMEESGISFVVHSMAELRERIILMPPGSEEYRRAAAAARAAAASQAGAADRQGKIALSTLGYMITE